MVLEPPGPVVIGGYRLPLNGPASGLIVPFRKSLVSGGKALEALHEAVRRWSAALDLPVPEPPLYRVNYPAMECGDPDAEACFGSVSRAIFLNETSESRDDLLWILLHEVGHSLGVPHIEGDPLMKPGSQEGDAALQHGPIPPMALAIARCRVAKLCP
jgi:hypothetical protein